MKAKDLTGKRYGAWTVVESAGKSPGLSRINLWKCKCDCGNESIVYVTVLNGGKSTCCKDCQRVKTAAARTTHGMAYSPTYISWKSMLARCENPNAPDYAKYGGAGVSVCEDWHKFELFVLDMGIRPEGKTLDRIDNAKGYTVDNCKWSTPKQQAENRRSNKYVEFKGEKMTYSEFGRRIGIDRRDVRYMIGIKKMTVDEVITVTKKGRGASTVSGATGV